MRKRFSFLAVGLVVAGLLQASAAHAEAGDKIGSATLIENLVTADFARQIRTLGSGDAVRQDEIIDVGLDARSEFNLDDDTKLALGPGTTLKLDRFVYDREQHTGSIILSMAKGSMRWITGVAKKPTYVIRVPHASITVRGTTFDLYVTEAGETWLLLHEGAVKVCNDRGQCQIHEQSCKLMRVSESGEVAKPQRWSSLAGAHDGMFHRAFPFVVLPPAIDPNPVCSRDAVLRLKDAAAPRTRVREVGLEPRYVPTRAGNEAAKPASRRAEKKPKVTPKPGLKVVVIEPEKPPRGPPIYVKPLKPGKPGIIIRVVNPRPPVRIVVPGKVPVPRYTPSPSRSAGTSTGKFTSGKMSSGRSLSMGALKSKGSNLGRY